MNPGDKVDVPWGLDTFHGVVVEVYGTGDAMRVRVRLDADDDDDAQVITVPADDVIAGDPESTESDFARYASWVRLAEYELQVRRALIAVSTKLHLAATVVSQMTIADRGLDILVESPELAIAVEIKWQIREFKKLIRSLEKMRDDLTQERSRPAAVLLVAPNAPRALVSHRQAGPFLLSERVAFSRWRGSEDDNRLEEAMTVLVTAIRDTHIGPEQAGSD